MEEKKLEISYQYFTDYQELLEEEQDLLQRAMQAAKVAFAPYSHFHVGCAVLLDSGEIITGNNQENIAFPSGICAERTALFYIGSQEKASQISKIAVRAFSTKAGANTTAPVLPCGGCRQVMVEYEKQANRDVILLAQGAEGDILRLEGIEKCLMPFHLNIQL